MPAGIAYGGAFIFLVAAFIVAWGLLTVYRLSLKPILLAVASLFYFSLGGFGVNLGRPLARIGDAITSAADSIDHGLGEAVIASESGIIWLWHALAKQAEWLGGLLGDLAETIEGKFRLWYLTFPPLAMIWAAVKAYQSLPNLTRAAHITKVTVVNETTKVYRLAVHAATLPMPWIRGRFGDVEGEIAGLRARLRRIEVPAIGALAVGVIAAALARLGIGWARCSNVGKTGKKVCGMNPDLLESLLADTLLIVGTVSLVDFAKEMQLVTREVVGPIKTFWRA